jgi:hypothetical protein
MKRFGLPVFVLSLGLLGCNEPNARLNAPPHGEPYTTAESQGTLVYMNDNALLANMTMCDMHFMPHRGLLNENGLVRLSRLGQLIQQYGGTIRLNTDETDESLISKRTDTIMQFLREAGLNPTSETLTRDLSGGRGMPATEAVLIRANEGMYKPGQSKKPSSNEQFQAGGSADSSK